MRRERDACAFGRIERACLAVVGRWDTKRETRAFHVKRALNKAGGEVVSTWRLCGANRGPGASAWSFAGPRVWWGRPAFPLRVVHANSAFHGYGCRVRSLMVVIERLSGSGWVLSAIGDNTLRLYSGSTLNVPSLSASRQSAARGFVLDGCVPAAGGVACRVLVAYRMLRSPRPAAVRTLGSYCDVSRETFDDRGWCWSWASLQTISSSASGGDHPGAAGLCRLGPCREVWKEWIAFAMGDLFCSAGLRARSRPPSAYRWAEFLVFRDWRDAIRGGEA